MEVICILFLEGGAFVDKGYVHLMSVYNGVEAENVKGILEMEGIKAIIEPSGAYGLINMAAGVQGIDIYVPEQSREEAMHILEVEMVRGDR